MRTQFGNAWETTKEIGGQFHAGRDRIAQRPMFNGFAKVTWPENTDAHVAAVCKCDVRTARRYLSGEVEPPSCAWSAMWFEATKRQ